MSYTGELAALAAAIFWAMASVIYRRLGVTIPPLLLNGIKGLVSLVFIGLTMLIASTVIAVDNINSWLLLLASDPHYGHCFDHHGRD